MRTKIPIEIIELEGEGIHLFVKGFLNDNEECSLIIDTGASKTVFDCHLPEHLFRKESIQEEVLTAGINAGEIETKIGIADNFTIGDLVIENFETILISLEHINTLYKKIIKKEIHGLIGSDFLMQHKANVDFRKKILSL